MTYSLFASQARWWSEDKEQSGTDQSWMRFASRWHLLSWCLHRLFLLGINRMGTCRGLWVMCYDSDTFIKKVKWNVILSFPYLKTFTTRHQHYLVKFNISSHFIKYQYYEARTFCVAHFVRQFYTFIKQADSVVDKWWQWKTDCLRLKM